MAWQAVAGIANSVGSTIPNMVLAAKGQRMSERMSQRALSRNKKALKAAKRQYAKTRNELAAYRIGGAKGLQQYSQRMFSGPEDYETSNKYGIKTDLMKTAGANAVSGQMNTGLQNAIARETRGMALADYDRHLSDFYKSLVPFQNLAAIGQNASAMTGQLGTQSGNIVMQGSKNVGNILMNAADNRSNYMQLQRNNTNNLVTNIVSALSSTSNNSKSSTPKSRTAAGMG